jgi:excisionase family DNA binding protein
MPAPVSERRALRPAEAAARYGVSRTFIDRMIREGVLHATKFGRVVLIDARRADALLLGTDTVEPGGVT